MGQHKTNPTAIAAKNGELPPKKKRIMGKRATKQLLVEFLAEKHNDESIVPLLKMCGPF